MKGPFDPARIAREAQRWVIKVGTSVLTDERELKVTRRCVQSIADQIAGLEKSKWGPKEVVLVTSGAIGIGMGALNLKARPRELAQLQAAAAAGQGKLMQWYAGRLEELDRHAAQILLTREDMEHPQRRQNVKGTLETLLNAGVVPIINENDTVSTEEIRYGDNDLLSAHVAVLIGADLLVNLTDVDQLIGPEGEPLIRLDEETLEKAKRAARGTNKESSTGGARTKFEAGKIALAHKIPMVVMSGRGGRASLVELLEGSRKGTWFVQ